MKSRQYTIRSVPPKLDEALRRRAYKSGKSLNQVAVEAMAQGVGVGQDVTFDDLDWFIGSGCVDDDALQRTQDWLASLPSDMDAS
jgi:hypothetical protein